MSGGVDSSVVAGLLVRRGFDVVGVTLQIWQESQTDPRHSGCCSLGAVEDARRVARILDIPHYVMNFREEFREHVIQNFADEYMAGRTPNPCVECNRTVKFSILMDRMRALGCERLATGHYARIRRDPNGDYRLLRARGGQKDQSYVLYMLTQDQLAATMFPLGELPGKAETRQMAREMGLPVADKPDSQEICFVSEVGGYREFLRRLRPEGFAQGDIVHEDGRRLGSHQGIAEFTVGQRRGIGVSDTKPLYVTRIEPETRRVIVGDGAALAQREVLLADTHVAPKFSGRTTLRVQAKVRYNMTPQPATVYLGQQPRIIFDDPVRAITPGQIAVAYHGMSVALGGKITFERLAGSVAA